MAAVMGGAYMRILTSSVCHSQPEERMAAALRSVRRLQQVLLLPRICVTGVRAESGGKSSPHTGITKTLVSFPVKVSNYQQPDTGENRNESLKPVKAPLLETGGSGGQSETRHGQEFSHSAAQIMDGTSHKEMDSSSSSSDSESEEEDNGLKSGESGGGHKRLPPVAQKSFMPGQIRLGKKSPVQEQNHKTDLRGKSSEHVQDCAPMVTTEDQNLQTAPLTTKWTVPDTDRMMAPDSSAVIEGATATTSVNSKKTKTLSRSEELLTKGVEMFSPESGTTQILSTTRTSEEHPAGGVDTLAPESMESHIISTTRTSEELPAGGVDTLVPDSMRSHIISTTRTSEELPAGGVDTLAPESMESHIISTTRTSEELPAVDEASELHGSHSSSEPRAPPQELFDNTKYQNLQHFTYTPFTFVDMDVEMAKYRLPQPSSGRPSPRH